MVERFNEKKYELGKDHMMFDDYQLLVNVFILQYKANFDFKFFVQQYKFI